LSEALARIWPAHLSRLAWEDLEQFRKARDGVSFIVDPEMGFRPVLGYRAHEGRYVYSDFGTIVNDYPARKRPDVERLLFIGDSVTARGRIIAGLRKLYGEAGYEYWNAGVESFNTRQEVLFYQKFNHRLEPDHVILTVHINDFQVTPVAFVDNDGYMRVYMPGNTMEGLSRVLFRYSELYRHYLSWTASQQAGFERASAEVRDSLALLQEELGSEIRLSVIIFPVLKPLQEWTDEEERTRARLLQFCDDLQLRCYDLTPLLSRQLSAGRTVRDSPTDVFHPNQSFGAAIAEFLFGQGLLDPAYSNRPAGLSRR
ncbi:MAG TPA: hypothetical protein VLU25_14410, partial [Acidobacteriota bacterium]|nr:hypothetical protein [Acidobacteriota bacterium]